MTGSITTVAINGTEHWVNRDGHRLHVWEKTGDKPPSVGKVTLLVHGGTYSGKCESLLRNISAASATSDSFILAC